MPTVTIQYFDGCPNWQLAGERVRAAIADRDDIALVHQLIETPEQAEQLGFAGSPTILIDGLDPFAEPGRPIGLSCRVYRTSEGLAGSPTIDQLIDALDAAAAPPDPADPTPAPVPLDPPRRSPHA